MSNTTDSVRYLLRVTIIMLVTFLLGKGLLYVIPFRALYSEADPPISLQQQLNIDKRGQWYLRVLQEKWNKNELGAATVKASRNLVDKEFILPDFLVQEILEAIAQAAYKGYETISSSESWSPGFGLYLEFTNRDGKKERFILFDNHFILFCDQNMPEQAYLKPHGLSIHFFKYGAAGLQKINAGIKAIEPERPSFLPE